MSDTIVKHGTMSRDSHSLDTSKTLLTASLFQAILDMAEYQLSKEFGRPFGFFVQCKSWQKM